MNSHSMIADDKQSLSMIADDGCIQHEEVWVDGLKSVTPAPERVQTFYCWNDSQLLVHT